MPQRSHKNRAARGRAFLNANHNANPPNKPVIVAHVQQGWRCHRNALAKVMTTASKCRLSTLGCHQSKAGVVAARTTATPLNPSGALCQSNHPQRAKATQPAKTQKNAPHQAAFNSQSARICVSCFGSGRGKTFRHSWRMPANVASSSGVHRCKRGWRAMARRIAKVKGKPGGWVAAWKGFCGSILW